MKCLLVVDDEVSHRMMIGAVMQDAGWLVDEAESGEEALLMLEQSRPTAVLLDMRMPGMGGQETLLRIKEIQPALPVVMLTAHGTVDLAVEAMKRGAFDYLLKPADNDELIAVLEKAGEYSRLISENDNLRQKLKGSSLGAEIIGQSAPIRRILDFIKQAGPSEATILVLGESGTGKELIAQALHNSSTRANNTMVKVNCAALPGELLESELFGYVKGAFTGAVRDKPGRFQLAKGGTIFLDEVGELPLSLQAKLLRVLQERVVEPLGGVAPVDVDVRIIAATNRNLKQEVAKGLFREDLYYRLNVLEIVAPPLRERLGDLPLLVSALLDKLARKNRKDVDNISPEFLEILSAYSWPGNVRELENVLEHSLIMTTEKTLTTASLPSYLLAHNGTEPYFSGIAADDFALESLPEGSTPLFPSSLSPSVSSNSLDEAECEALKKALDACGGHRERTADALGISRRTLQYKLKKFGLIRK